MLFFSSYFSFFFGDIYYALCGYGSRLDYLLEFGYLDLACVGYDCFLFVSTFTQDTSFRWGPGLVQVLGALLCSMINLLPNINVASTFQVLLCILHICTTSKKIDDIDGDALLLK